MQDKDVEPDEDLCVKVNLYLSDTSEAASAAGASTDDDTGVEVAADGVAGTGGNGMDNAELLRIMQGALGQEGGARVGTVPGANSIPSAGAGQVRYRY